MSSPEPKTKKKGRVANLIRFFSGKDEEETKDDAKPGISGFNDAEYVNKGFDLLKDKLSNSKKAVIVMVFGPSRSGKSTILNFLTVRNYPYLKNSGIPKKSSKKNKSIFKVGGGEGSCTREFQFYMITASNFRRIHHLDSEPDNDFDIYFIDSEGFSNKGDGASKNLFLGLFTLTGVSSMQLFMHRESMLNEGRIECIAKNIVSTSLFGNAQPLLVSVARGNPKGEDGQKAVEEESDNRDDIDDIDDDNEDDDDFDDDSDSESEDEDSQKKDNENLYREFNDEDKRNKPTFIESLEDYAVIKDRNKIEILTIPDCIQYNKEAHYRRLQDLSRLILNGTNPRSGSELYKEVEKTFNQVREKCGLIEGELSLDSVYSKLLNELFDSIKSLEKGTEKKFKDFIVKKELREIKALASNGPLNKDLTEYIKGPYASLEQKITKYVPLKGLDAITKTLLGKIEKESEVRMKNVVFNALMLEIVWRDNKAMIHKLYQVNKSLQVAKEGQTVSIKLIDKDGVETNKRVEVIVLHDSFNYENSKDGKIDQLHYIFPTGIKITKITTHVTTDVKLRIITKQKTTTEINEEDITEGYHFDFISMRAFPKTKDKYRKSIYKYLYNPSFLDYFLMSLKSYPEIINKSTIKISVDKTHSRFKLINCDVTEFDDVTTGDRKTEEKTLNPKEEDGYQEIVINAKPHEKHDKTNETRITSISFELK